MKKISFKSNIIVIGAFILLLAFICVIGASYAYFTVQAPTNHVEITASSATLGNLEFTGSPINLTGKPGATSNTTVSVRNLGAAGTIPVKYGIRLVIDSIDFVATDANGGDILLEVESLSGCTPATTTKYLSTADVGTSVMIVNEATCDIAASLTHQYKVTATFRETNVNQNDNQGKSFTTHLEAVVPNQQG